MGLPGVRLYEAKYDHQTSNLNKESPTPLQNVHFKGSVLLENSSTKDLCPAAPGDDMNAGENAIALLQERCHEGRQFEVHPASLSFIQLEARHMPCERGRKFGIDEGFVERVYVYCIALCKWRQQADALPSTLLCLYTEEDAGISCLIG
ncbi:hypothetical protein CAPTEDRAFT_190591 [Capitella teleta]|uniref:Uncharacterized protein n=1 Tax=Capitella teleta TaxID=283909 RepID=R7UB57_CAPTE|nr:hypothetical protein CAPTEDRAFT_190591 [Capitella teleta]|eukprot:ELU03356.1 hypothetical protein CAPTEDRAFT_190591 [Capitella teleta]